MVDVCGIISIMLGGFCVCYFTCRYCSSPKCEETDCECDCTKCCTICKKCCTCDSSNRVQQQQNAQATDTVITNEPIPVLHDLPVYGVDMDMDIVDGVKYFLPSYEVAIVSENEPVICGRFEILPPPPYG